MEPSRIKQEALLAVRNIPGFLEGCERIDSERKLQDPTVPDGTYILRASNHPGNPRDTKVHVLSVTVKDKIGQIRHFPVYATFRAYSIEYMIAETVKRDNLQELMDYHSRAELSGIVNTEASNQTECRCVLKYPYKEASTPVVNLRANSSPRDQRVPVPREHRNGQRVLNYMQVTGIQGAAAVHGTTNSGTLPHSTTSSSSSQGSFHLGNGDLSSLTSSDTTSSEDHCRCGMPRDCTILPDGWSVHISTNNNSRGLLYFKNAEGETSWMLHPRVDQKCNNQPYTRNYLRCGDLNLLVHKRYMSMIPYPEPNNYIRDYCDLRRLRYTDFEPV